LFETTLAIDILDMFLSIFHQNLSYILQISSFTINNNLLSNLRVFREQIVLQKSFAKGYALHIRHGNKDKLRLLVCTNVVIANEGTWLLFDSELELLRGQALGHKVVTNAYDTLLDEVHVSYFVLLVQNKFIFIDVVELLWSEAKADIVKELRVVVF
tara:strand:- start:27 stop:497 length:471 start_codon:yes stop_codon:yes gene_type:complete